MAGERILTFNVPTASSTTHFQIEYSADRSTWTKVKVAAATDLAVALLSDRKYTLDGINTVDDDDNNRQAASRPPSWYRLRLKSASGYGNWRDPFVFPSGEDFLLGMKHHLRDPKLDDDANAALLTDFEYLMHVEQAVTAYERSHPRILSQTFALTASTLSYDLPDEWQNGYSSIEAVEYPTGESLRQFKPVSWVFIDEVTGEWRVRRLDPATGESACLFYRTRHARDGSTVPVSDFAAVLKWAAGSAAHQIMAHKNQFGDVLVGADYVAVDPRIKLWGQIAKTWKEEAERAWGAAVTGLRVQVPFQEDHGRVPQSVWGS